MARQWWTQAADTVAWVTSGEAREAPTNSVPPLQAGMSEGGARNTNTSTYPRGSSRPRAMIREGEEVMEITLEEPRAVVGTHDHLLEGDSLMHKFFQQMEQGGHDQDQGMD